eukprot:TRINITY_DN74871_c0_g1_i1.p1 TRINITY_DN74871_c0_g1~~TRINITY_DN74871_c0_g1_i1.p1  ORF type:complete len:680 (+),score=21.87 TRINITY_DN74871_c0_g1_i1:154-2193(+)
MDQFGQLSITTTRNLSDNRAETRRKGANEVDAVIRTLKADQQGEPQIQSVIGTLANQFTKSVQPSMRKGGLLALAAVAVALGSDVDKLQRCMDILVDPVLQCFKDHDVTVRISACDAMFNIAKVARDRTLRYFGQIFNSLVQLSQDPDQKVRSVASILNGLVKTIAADTPAFDIHGFISVAKGHLNTNNSYVRQFLVGWLAELEPVPELNLIQQLPEFLDQLFGMLTDRNKDILQATEALLTEFERQVTEDPESAPLQPLVDILFARCNSTEDRPRQVALQWCVNLLKEQPEEMLPFCAAGIGAVLPCMSTQSEEIRHYAAECNNALQSIVKNHCQPNDKKILNKVISVLQEMLLRQEVQARVAALRWLLLLTDHSYDVVFLQFTALFPLLLQTLADINSSEEVITLDLAVLAKLSKSADTFNQFLEELVRLLDKGRKKLMTRAALGHIVKQLCSLIDPEKLFCALSTILREEAARDKEFVATVVQLLNMILLTISELTDFRNTLKRGLQKRKTRQLFVELYQCWSYSPVSTLSLCLFSMAYEHAYRIVCTFGDMEITVKFLGQIDTLVHLLESGIFAHVRIHLLEPQRYPYLVKALCGVLMLLPQSATFDLLKNRLKCIATVGLTMVMDDDFGLAQHWNLPATATQPAPPTTRIDWNQLALHFRQVHGLPGLEQPGNE